MRRFPTPKLPHLPTSAIFALPRTTDARMIKSGFNCQTYRSNRLLEYLLQSGDIESARKMFDEMPNWNNHTVNMMIAGHAEVGDLAGARKLFDLIWDSSPVSWTILMGGYSQLRQADAVFAVFREMVASGVKADRAVLITLLGSCGDPNCVNQVHAHALKSGFGYSLTVCNTLVDAYCKFGLFSFARDLFDEMPHRDTVTYNALIMGFCKDYLFFESVQLFLEMRYLGVDLTNCTFTSVLTAASGLADLRFGRQLHSLVVKTNSSGNVFVDNSVLDFYSKCNVLVEARRLFDEMEERNLISYNVMISGYVWNEQKTEFFDLCKAIQFSGFDREGFPFPSMLKMASELQDINMGKQIHAQVILIGLAYDDPVTTSIIDMYAKCGQFSKAKMIFESRATEGTFMWTTMISAYVRNGFHEEALSLFSRLREVGLNPDHTTFSSILRSTANLALLALGRQLHSYVTKLGYLWNVFVGSALVDLYAKCGRVAECTQMFDEMPSRSVVSWNSMICAYAQNNKANHAVRLFEEMLRKGFQPESVTFLGLLSACSRSEYIDEGLRYFDLMSKAFKIQPGKEHYVRAIDLLGRAGQFDKIHELIAGMPFKPDQIFWTSVLNSCMIHKNKELAIIAAEKLSSMNEMDDAGPYVLMANFYAAAGMWEAVAKVKKKMRDRGLRKEPGYSWVEIKNTVYKFSSNDRMNPQREKISELLKELAEEMLKRGYKPDTSYVIQKLGDDEDAKAESLMNHSERLAVAFALINTPPGAPVTVLKNLRTCGDCHTVMKVIADVVGREITVRDSRRFHHFKGGTCSCGDYW